MECPNWHNEEINGTGFNRVIKKIHLKMEHVGYEDGYDYYQCPRCAVTRKQKNSFLSSGLTENLHHEEIKKIAEKSASVGLGIPGSIAIIFAIIIFIGVHKNYRQR